MAPMIDHPSSGLPPTSHRPELGHIVTSNSERTGGGGFCSWAPRHQEKNQAGRWEMDWGLVTCGTTAGLWAQSHSLPKLRKYIYRFLQWQRLSLSGSSLTGCDDTGVFLLYLPGRHNLSNSRCLKMELMVLWPRSPAVQSSLGQERSCASNA